MAGSYRERAAVIVSIAMRRKPVRSRSRDILRPTSFGQLGPEDRDIYTEAGRPEMSKYTVFIEPTATSYSAYVPDLPGCIAAASTLEETRQPIKEAIEFHIEGMRINGEAVPEPTRLVEQVEVSAMTESGNVSPRRSLD
jgi:predicted RNase H-like HicB family nuclease